jgi:DNA-binding IclR family transcriptional regulator
LIQSVSHALDLLEQFPAGPEEIGVTDLSRRLKLHKNNVFRLLATLEARGYIEQNRTTENYRLAVKCLHLGHTYLRQTGFVLPAKGTLNELARRTGESVFVAMRKGKEVVPLDFVESGNAVRVASFLGSTFPLHCTAPGKVHLAFDSEQDLENGVGEALLRYTGKTIVDRGDLVSHIREVRGAGFAVDLGEYIDEVRCVAVPLRDYSSSLVGTLSVTGPGHRLSQERIERDIVPVLVAEGNDLSRRLGYSG